MPNSNAPHVYIHFEETENKTFFYDNNTYFTIYFIISTFNIAYFNTFACIK